MSYSRPQWQTAKTFLKIGNLGLFLFTCPLLLEWTSLSHRSLISTRASKVLFLGNWIFFLFVYTSSFYLRLVQRNGHPFVIGHLYPQEHARFIFGQNSVPSLLTYDPQVILELTEKTFLLFCIKFVEPDQGWFDTYNNRVKFVGIAPNKEAKTYGANVIIGKMWNPIPDPLLWNPERM